MILDAKPTKVHTLHIIQHVSFETPGRILDWAQTHRIATPHYNLYAGKYPPAPGQGEALCILGGPMNIYEDQKYPWLAWEREFLAEQARRQVTMVGICLGAQLLAQAHGARVYPNRVKEIGWMPVAIVDQGLREEASLPDSIIALHWHGDTFDLPVGARHLARTQHCLNQGFLIGSSLGLQFHLEAGSAECSRMIQHCGAELMQSAPSIHSAEAIRVQAEEHAPRAAEGLNKLLDWHCCGCG